MLSCCKSRKPSSGETQPLLQHNGVDTERERKILDKLHKYEMFRALSAGYMPSTSQIVSILQNILSSEFLNPSNPTLSRGGKLVARDCRSWMRIFIGLLRDKNGNDQLQEIIYQFSGSQVSVDTSNLASSASISKMHADSAAAYESIRTVGGLLLTNADFRRLVKDVSTVGRSIFSDTSAAVSAAAKQVAKEVEPSKARMDGLKSADEDNSEAPSTEQLAREGEDTIEAVKDGVEQVASDVTQNIEENVSGEVKDTLFQRLKQTVEGLRQRDDYQKSIITISGLVQRYAKIYTNAATSTILDSQEVINVSPELNLALRTFWKFLESFGDPQEWHSLEHRFQRLMHHSENKEEIDDMLKQIGDSLYKLFTEPDFFDTGEETVQQLKEKLNETKDDIVTQDVKDFVKQLKRTLRSAAQDPGISKLIEATKKIGTDVSAAYQDERTRIIADALHIFLPILIRAIQHIPLPRLEISVPEMDLLLENVVFEPGHTINNSSFFPYQILVSMVNNMELRKTHSKEASSSMKNMVTVTLNGLNVSANDFGYWIRVHNPPFLPFGGDEGIASFKLDRRGMDLSFEFEVGRDRLEQILALRGVRVHIHKLDYTIGKSNWSWLWWLTKPFLKHMVRRVIEKSIAEKIVEAAHTINRELVFARERLRATRIADPDDLSTFVRAVMSRLSVKSNPDLYTRIGIDSERNGMFDGVYAPGSLVKLWRETQQKVDEQLEAGEQPTWRNNIFSIPRRYSP
ncbi:hypothetical protein FQN57_002815 [Myotisia sp. PD_48]|nr:hypothetical protein FQN57_002815 [Myotisia sp. PD_48]